MSDPAGTLPSGVAPVARKIAAREIDLGVRIRRGLVAGTATREIFARAQVENGTWEQATAWTTIASAPVGGDPSLFPLPAAGPVSVVSTSALDTIGGTGAQVFEVLGVEQNGAGATNGAAAPWITASVPLSGTTPVQTTGVNFYGGMAECGGVTSAGAQFTNQGTLTVTRVSDGKVLYTIPPLWGHTLTARITVPDGWVGVIRRMSPYWDGDTQAHWRLRVHQRSGVRWSLAGGSVQRENSGTSFEFAGGHVIPGGSTFWFEAVRQAGGAVANAILTIFAPVEFYRE